MSKRHLIDHDVTNSSFDYSSSLESTLRSKADSIESKFRKGRRIVLRKKPDKNEAAALKIGRIHEHLV